MTLCFSLKMFKCKRHFNLELRLLSDQHLSQDKEAALIPGHFSLKGRTQACAFEHGGGEPLPSPPPEDVCLSNQYQTSLPERQGGAFLTHWNGTRWSTWQPHLCSAVLGHKWATAHDFVGHLPLRNLTLLEVDTEQKMHAKRLLSVKSYPLQGTLVYQPKKGCRSPRIAGDCFSGSTSMRPPSTRDSHFSSTRQDHLVQIWTDSASAFGAAPLPLRPCRKRMDPQPKSPFNGPGC